MDSSKANAVVIAVREAPLRNTQVDCKKPNEDLIIKYLEECPKALIVDGTVYNFDNVFNSSVTQSELYETLIHPLVLKVLDGYDCTALAYGQTGTGKSYSMGMSAEKISEEHMGVVPRCLRDILDGLSKQYQQKEINSPKLAYASFIEIYNEKAYDLLALDTRKPLASRGQRRFTGGTCQPLRNQHDLHQILELGTKNRHVRSTNMNLSSSRSHAIVTIHIKQGLSNAHLNIVDLAGSESIRRTGNEGMARAEGVYINMGLLGINKVMLSMSAGHTVIPYRDTILTTVLQDSLSAGSYLTLLACISPHATDLSETTSTLRFAKSARNVKLAPRMNQQLQQLQQNVRSATKKYKNAQWLRRLLPSSTVIKRPLDVRAHRVTSNSFSTPAKVTARTQLSRRHQSEIDLTPQANKCIADMHKMPEFLKPAQDMVSVQKLVPIKYAPVLDQINCSLEDTLLAAPSRRDCILKNCNDDRQQQEQELSQFCQNELVTDAKPDKSMSLLNYNEFTSELCSIDEENDENNIAGYQLNSTLTTRNVRNPSSVRVSGISFLSSSPSPIVKNKTIPAVGQRRSIRIMSRGHHIDVITNKGQEQTQPHRSMRIALQVEVSPKRQTKKLPDNLSTKCSQGRRTANKVTQLGENVFNQLGRGSQNTRLRNHRSNLLELLNSATITELQALPCIGPKTAFMLLMQRSLLGQFKNWRDVQKLPIWRGNSWSRFATANCIEI